MRSALISVFLFVAPSIFAEDVLIEGASDNVLHIVDGNTSQGTSVIVETNNTSGYYANGISAAVSGTASNNTGIIGLAEGAGDGGSNIGVEALAYGQDYATGIYAAAYYGSNNTAGYFDGNVIVTGACDPCSPSDEIFKKNIRPLRYGLSTIMALHPKSYEMKSDEFKGKVSLPLGERYGLIAEEVQGIVPELVHEVASPPHLTPQEMKAGKKGEPFKFKALNYKELIPIMMNAIQEQEAKIEALETKIQQLQTSGK